MKLFKMMQEEIPDVALINILSYLPSQSFLPISHVSRRFKNVWIQYKDSKNDHDDERQRRTSNETNPLALGHLFESSWYSQTTEGKTNQKSNKLNTNLLSYFVSNGYGRSSNNFDGEVKSRILKKVMLETVSRGDIDGMWFMSCKNYCHLDDIEICTMAAAAGQLEALKWLRGDKVNGFKESTNVICPWDPTEVHREAAENLHDDVMEYVEKNCKNHEIQMHYGVGLPW